MACGRVRGRGLWPVAMGDGSVLPTATLCCNQRSGTNRRSLRRNDARRLRQEQEGARNSGFRQLHERRGLSRGPGLWHAVFLYTQPFP